MGTAAKKKIQTSRKKLERKLTRATMIDLHQARQYLGLDTLKETGLRMPVRVYFKDPAVAESTEGAGIDETFTTPWEPGLGDGPTSARFAVVDYDATNNVLTPPAIWNPRKNCYLAPDRKTALDENEKTRKLYQYHQLSVWATVQNTLDFFESGAGLGRRVSWAFEGNRLIIVPHAGYGENAYYDRASKSLQLYWFDSDKGRVFTCLSSDIVNHEFGHAVLDGLRPYYLESIGAQAAAFHEFMGDLTAILMAFRNNPFRKVVLKESNGKLTDAQLLAGLAREFGEATTNAPYLRTGLNNKTMKKLAGNLEPHALSEVLTGAMFDILMGVFAKHQKNEVKRAKAGGSKQPSDIRALADTVPRMQMLAIQPLDLLPPCAVTFRDYALAVLRAEYVANPTDPSGYRQLMIDCFIKRGILEEADRKKLMEPAPVFRRPALDVFHSVELDRSLARRRLPLSRRQSRQAVHSFERRYRNPRDRARQQAHSRRATVAAADHRPISLARGAGARRQQVRPLCRRTHHDAMRRDHGARPERQPDPLGPQARYRQRRHLEDGARRTGRGHAPAQGASRYDRRPHRGRHDR